MSPERVSGVRGRECARLCVVSNLMPRGDDDFDGGPRTPPQPTGSPGYDRDFARAEQDRGSYGLVSAAYWIVRAVQKLYRLIRRR
jgi:hypothetical protein